MESDRGREEELYTESLKIETEKKVELPSFMKKIKKVAEVTGGIAGLALIGGLLYLGGRGAYKYFTSTPKSSVVYTHPLEDPEVMKVSKNTLLLSVANTNDEELSGVIRENPDVAVYIDTEEYVTNSIKFINPDSALVTVTYRDSGEQGWLLFRKERKCDVTEGEKKKNYKWKLENRFTKYPAHLVSQQK